MGRTYASFGLSRRGPQYGRGRNASSAHGVDLMPVLQGHSPYSLRRRDSMQFTPSLAMVRRTTVGLSRFLYEEGTPTNKPHRRHISARRGGGVIGPFAGRF